MDMAHSLVRNAYHPWTVITARHQTEGRGTHGRLWSSQTDKGLWLSLLLPPPENVDNLTGLSIIAAGSLVKTLDVYADCMFLIKYPNDVVVNNHKIAGLMIESATCDDAVKTVILGMGVNFWQTRDDFIKDELPDATSLFIEAGYAPDREHFIATFISYMKKWYESGIPEPDYGKLFPNSQFT
ncbi:biotin--[acetyl-CoA-carboxylase] ligase [bacterium]|nr:biotin--[acetyl-CoA-carboxylase] ligase [bacterium]